MLEATRAPPSVSVTSPEGRSVPEAHSPRRGFSKLRNFTHSRLQGSSSPSETPRSSPRPFFARSVSYTERRPAPEGASRRRSASRPDAHRRDLESVAISGSSTSAALLSTASPSNSRPSTATDQPIRSLSNQSPDLTIMARNRTSSAAKSAPPDTSRSTEAQRNARLGTNGIVEVPLRNRATSGSENPVTAGDNSDSAETKPQLPTIRFFPHQDIRNGRQSLPFTPIARTLPSESSIIRVGRYSEREGIPASNPTTPSDAPVGFKSKVVSRKHCEFSFSNGQWQLKDVCSSSGTFLNHIRLSQPNMESKLFPVKDGDIVQLGIDFRGGEEMIFRCVKIRIECNRSWQKRPNNFNMSRHAQLQSLGKTEATSQDNSGECTICLSPVMPCQSLFVAPCAHVWHYKCIRPMLEGKNSSYPEFQCPNCRAWTDLSAEVDVVPEDLDEWMENNEDALVNAGNGGNNDSEVGNDPRTGEDAAGIGADQDAMPEISEPERREGTAINAIQSTDGNATSNSNLLSRRQASNPTSPAIASLNGIDIPAQLGPSITNSTQVAQLEPGIDEGLDIISGEGPLTPRNNAGPFVFDGSAGRSGNRITISSIDRLRE